MTYATMMTQIMVPQGELMSCPGVYWSLKMRYATKQVVTTMKSLPRNMKMQPTVEVAPNLRQFLTMRRNPFLAEVQKFFPVIAIWIYAFLVINLMHFSRHQRQ